MSNIAKISKVYKSCPEELKELAISIREIADDIEKGEILAVAWASINVNDKYQIDYVKARGVSKLALCGAVGSLHHDINQSLLSDNIIE